MQKKGKKEEEKIIVNLIALFGIAGKSKSLGISSNEINYFPIFLIRNL